MTKTSRRRSACPLNAALEMVGDRWSLLIVRDLMFGSGRSFREFLEADEKIATNILASRLQSLEENGLIDRRPDPGDARKTIYRLTAKGVDLAPVLVEMIVWGARYEKTAAPPAAIRRMTRDRDAFVADLRERWKTDDPAAGRQR
ncbi:MAG: winged helix-turn-helix transcriptional regulator [Caulobacteraceae bacterium]